MRLPIGRFEARNPTSAGVLRSLPHLTCNPCNIGSCVLSVLNLLQNELATFASATGISRVVRLKLGDQLRWAERYR
ncbi:MAG: hypothetical protein SAK29_24145 [Scytonema sp. PMC 1069.18]|nr:hypothetical protein [Scytonema sp. PMC 1069.18]MEC4886093.1 hypothetical protein [Scytonema sp. PMC 1070.18]